MGGSDHGRTASSERDGRVRPGSPVRRRRFQVLRRVLGALVLASIIAVITLVGAGRVAGYRTYVVRSGSMGAAAPVGSVVVTRPKPAADVAVGDVVMLPAAPAVPSLPILHRVIERSVVDGQVLVRTKGDANATADAERTVLTGAVLIMQAAIPHAGHVVSFLQTPLGWFACVVLPILGIALHWVRRYWQTDGRPARSGVSAARN